MKYISNVPFLFFLAFLLATDLSDKTPRICKFSFLIDALFYMKIVNFELSKDKEMDRVSLNYFVMKDTKRKRGKGKLTL